jgi:hypothetical protein
MADLLAIISHRRTSPLAADDLHELISAYVSLRGPVTTQETVSTDWAAVAVVDRPAPPSVGIEHYDGGWAAWAGSVVGSLRSAEPLDRLDGQFALARLDTRNRTLELATDPLGMKPLFVAERDGKTYASTSALVLAKCLRVRPSQVGLEAFLRSGTQFGRATQWEGVSRLTPAQLVEFTPGGRRTRTYWMPEIDEAMRDLDIRQCAEACVETATGALAHRYWGAHPWLDLTGGFDTRLLALLARRAGMQFMANTSGDAGDEDVVLARRIAAAAGWSWAHFQLPGDWGERLAAHVDEAVAWGDSHLDALQLAEVMSGHREKSVVETSLLNGGGGEHYRDYPWGHELLGSGRSNRVSYDRLIAWRLLGPIELTVFREDPTAAATSLHREELERRAAPFSSMSNTVQCDILYALKATGHFSTYQAAAGAWMHMELPFYLAPVFSCAISVPPRHRNFHRLMRVMMQCLDPGVAAIPTETGGPAAPLGLRNAYRFAPYPWRRAKRFANRLRNTLPSGPAGSVPSLCEAARGAFVARLRREGRLDPARMASAGLYRREPLAMLLDRAVADPAAVDWTTIGRIVTVELALEAVDAELP